MDDIQTSENPMSTEALSLEEITRIRLCSKRCYDTTAAKSWDGTKTSPDKLEKSCN